MTSHSCVCVLIRLHMCPQPPRPTWPTHTSATYVAPHTLPYVSAYFSVCARTPYIRVRMPQADFANEHVGGGVLGRGCVQEEIRFLIAPELIVSKVFTSKFECHESMLICGSEIFSRHSGYRGTFRWDGLSLLSLSPLSLSTLPLSFISLSLSLSSLSLSLPLSHTPERESVCERE
jgi:hypothetical protein